MADTAGVLRARYGTRPFRASDVVGDAVSRGQLRAACAAGVLVRLRRDAYVLAGEWEYDPAARHLLAARAAQLVIPGAVVSHWSAALAHRLPAPTRRDGCPARPTLTHPTRSRRSADLRLVAADLAPVDTVVLDDLVVTGLARTGVDVAVDRPLAHALVVLDAVARRLLLAAYPDEPAELVVGSPGRRAQAVRLVGEAAARRRDPRGTAELATQLDEVDPRAESALESWSRAALLRGGLPRPELQLTVHGASGREYRADFAWPERKVLGEADGRLKYTAPGALWAEKLREDDLRRAGWVIVRWTWPELMRDGDALLARIRRELAA